MNVVVFINADGKSDTRSMECVPRIGDVIPIFSSTPPAVVTRVVWFPEEFDEVFKDMDVDAVLTVS